jgi:hypothetical protein
LRQPQEIRAGRVSIHANDQLIDLVHQPIFPVLAIKQEQNDRGDIRLQTLFNIAYVEAIGPEPQRDSADPAAVPDFSSD